MKPIRSGDKSVQLQNNRPTLSGEQDGYFLRLILITSVTTAQSIITKLNKSEYVTIWHHSFHKVTERMAPPPHRLPG